LQSTGNGGSLQGGEECGHPWNIVRIIQHAKRFAKGKITHDVERSEVEPADHVYGRVVWLSCLLVQFGNQGIDVLCKDSFLLAQRAFAEGVGKDTSHVRVRLVVRRQEASHAVGIGPVGSELLVEGQLVGLAEAVDVLPGPAVGKAKRIRSEADHGAVALVERLNPQVVVAGQEVGKVGKGGASPEERAGKPAKRVQKDVVYEDSYRPDGQLVKY
jgi:hypothetical protein